MKPFFQRVILISIIFFGGCRTANTGLVFPREDGTFEIISRGYTETGAMSRAVRQAEKTCKERFGTYIVLDRSLTYHGILSPEANKIENSIGNSIGSLTHSRVPSASTSEDYKATLITRCEPLPPGALKT